MEGGNIVETGAGVGTLGAVKTGVVVIGVAGAPVTLGEEAFVAPKTMEGGDIVEAGAGVGMLGVVKTGVEEMGVAGAPVTLGEEAFVAPKTMEGGDIVEAGAGVGTLGVVKIGVEAIGVAGVLVTLGEDGNVAPGAGTIVVAPPLLVTAGAEGWTPIVGVVLRVADGVAGAACAARPTMGVRPSAAATPRVKVVPGRDASFIACLLADPASRVWNAVAVRTALASPA